MAERCKTCGEPVYIAHVRMIGVVWRHCRLSVEMEADHKAESD